MMTKFIDENGKTIELDIRLVEKVYSGKPHTCMCGCAGKYFYSSTSKKEYIVINDNFIKRVVKKFEKFEGKIKNNLNENIIFTIETSPTRQYTIFMKQD